MSSRARVFLTWGRQRRAWFLGTAAALVLALAGCAAGAPPTSPTAPAAVPSPATGATAVSPVPTAAPTPLPPTETPIPAATATLGPAATLNPAGRVGLGAYFSETPYDRFAAALAFEELLQHRLQYVLWFQAWGNDDREFLTDLVRLAGEHGWIPVITWEPWERSFADPTAPQPPYSLDSIAAGQHDAYIRSWAHAAHSLGVPIVLRFAHEQSTEPGSRLWYPWQGDPEGYRAAFRHIVALFRQEGADNVQFMWSAMWLNSWAASYYPGDDVVDLVGTTVLNHGTGAATEWARWRSFAELFDEQYQAALQWGVPIVITELATAEQGGDKAAWLHECFASLEVEYSLVEGVLLLEVTSDREWPAINWSVASSSESLAAFRAAISDPHFR